MTRLPGYGIVLAQKTEGTGLRLRTLDIFIAAGARAEALR